MLHELIFLYKDFYFLFSLTYNLQNAVDTCNIVYLKSKKIMIEHNYFFKINDSLTTTNLNGHLN